MPSRIHIDPEGWARRLVDAQLVRPWRFLIGVLLVTIVAGLATIGLRFDSSYDALLPVGAPEVQHIQMVRDRTGGFRQVVVAIEGEDPEARLDFGRRLLPLLREVKNVRSAEFELPVGFFADRGIWLMDAEQLEGLVRDVDTAVRASAFPFGMVDPHTAWKRVELRVDSQRERLPFHGDVLTSKDGRFSFLTYVPAVKFTESNHAEQMVGDMVAAVESLDPAASGVSVRYAGNMMVFQEIQETTRKDLRNAGIVALLFGVLVVAVVTRKWVAPLVVGGALVAGVGWTFAVVRLTVGHVNVITGFLGAVLLGLGIDFGIHLLLRYQQERGKTGATGPGAVRAAVVGTLPPALTGALTTAGTFVSFAWADFRGFSEFGLIAGLGVVMTLVSIFLVMPPLMLLLDARLARRLPAVAGYHPRPVRRSLAWAMVVVVGLFALSSLPFVGNIPFRNDYRLLRGESPATDFLEYVDANLGFGFNPAVFMVDDIDAARALSDRALWMRANGRPDGLPSRVGAVFSVANLVPDDLQARRGWIEMLARLVDNPALDRVAASDDARANRLQLARRMVRTVPWTLDDLPDAFRQRFLTLDGDDLLVYVWPDEQNHADWQAANWEDELSLLSGWALEQGVEHEMADETLFIAWIYRMIQADGPPLLLLASVVVLGFLLLDFRSLWRVALVSSPLLVGMLCFVGAMHAWGAEINMFNIIVVPSVIGIGIDNAVHVYHRYRVEGPGSVDLVVRRTGLAAGLASLTTAVGFGSSLICHGAGLRSMGSLAIMGIASTFVAATVFFPCLLVLLEGRKARSKGMER